MTLGSELVLVLPLGLVATSTAILIAAAVAAATTAVTVSEAHQAGKAQKSAAEAAGRTQAQAFEASQQSFAALLPQIPQPEAIKEQAKEEATRRKKQQALTVLTSPVGIVGEPNISRKTLLGQ